MQNRGLTYIRNNVLLFLRSQSDEFKQVGKLLIKVVYCYLFDVSEGTVKDGKN